MFPVCYMLSTTSSATHSPAIDATVYGNAARYINQSCSANLELKAIPGSTNMFCGYKRVHVGFYTLKDGGGVGKGEELTVCYNPQSTETADFYRNIDKVANVGLKEDDVNEKVLCCCGHWNCNKFL